MRIMQSAVDGIPLDRCPEQCRASVDPCNRTLASHNARPLRTTRPQSSISSISQAHGLASAERYRFPASVCERFQCVRMPRPPCAEQTAPRSERCSQVPRGRRGTGSRSAHHLTRVAAVLTGAKKLGESSVRQAGCLGRTHCLASTIMMSSRSDLSLAVGTDQQPNQRARYFRAHVRWHCCSHGRSGLNVG